MDITTVGLDLAKNVFQVHAIGSTGEVVVRRSLRRAQVIPFFSKLPPCLGSIPPALSALRLGSGPQHGLGSGPQHAQCWYIGSARSRPRGPQATLPHSN